ncbi:MAG TPA: tRNA (adenosine(37)-N6)-dimethylallyltransferase MiaA [Rudaea sp.]|nr:tRNA (adenosine(37)-N6)-dimethylallyltransferase MiaA [Rudaea sp.]
MTIDTRPPAIFLMGPTASGKTALACALAERYPLAIVSVDSALVYRGLDIGAAKPDAHTLHKYPHRLIDIRDPAEPYSAAEFRADALREMDAIAASGKIPLLVGGTGLYFRALQSGLSSLPEADAALRKKLAAEADAIGWTAMHARLRERDPVAAEKIRPSDAQRIQRALEVIELTGRPLSAQQGGLPAPFGYRVLKLALVPADRGALHLRIVERMDAMIADGFLDEVRALRTRGDLHTDLPALRAVGYRQAWQHLDGEFGAAEFRDRAVFATRQLAKRQLTWLRSELDARTLDPFAQGHIGQARGAVADFLAGPAS